MSYIFSTIIKIQNIQKFGLVFRLTSYDRSFKVIKCQNLAKKPVKVELRWE